MADQDLQKEYQDYQEYQHYAQDSQQAANPQMSPDAADKSSHNGAQTLPSPNPDQSGALKRLLSPPKYNPQIAFGIPVPSGASAIGRIGINTAMGAAQGGADSPDDRVKGALIGGAVGGGVGALGEGVSSLASKGADSLMKWATGIRKAPEGIGNNLVDQGVWGTKGGMLDQVGDKLTEQESKLQGLVSSLKGSTDSQEIADAISRQGDKFVSPSGITIPQVSGDLDKIREAAGSFSSQGEGGELSPSDLLSLKRQGDWAGYTSSGNPASATDSEIGRTIADRSRGLLSDMSGGETADTLGKERALIYAKKALDRDPTTHMGLGSSLFFGKMPGADVGGSLAAQGLQKGVATPAKALSNPAIVQGLLGGLFESSRDKSTQSR